MTTSTLCTTCQHREFDHRNYGYDSHCLMADCTCPKFMRWNDQAEKAVEQPKPKLGIDDVNDWLVEFIRTRSRMGEQKYGTRLMSHNGRDPFIDLLQELGDACAYISQWILESDLEIRVFLENELDYILMIIRRLMRLHELGNEGGTTGELNKFNIEPRRTTEGYEFEDPF